MLFTQILSMDKLYFTHADKSSFDCLFGFFRPTPECFTHMETSPLPVSDWTFLPLHSWPISSEGSLACHTYKNTGHPFIMVISGDTWHSHLLPSVWQWSCPWCFYDYGLNLYLPLCKTTALTDCIIDATLRFHCFQIRTSVHK